jgi:hypothetical protein
MWCAQTLYLSASVGASIGCASVVGESERGGALLGHARTVLEAAAALLTAARAAAGNHRVRTRKYSLILHT